MPRRKIPPLRPAGTVDSAGAAKLIGVSRPTFFRYRQEADFPQPVQLGRGGRHSLYSEADLLKWKAKRESAGSDPAPGPTDAPT